MTRRNGIDAPRELDVVEVITGGLEVPRGTQGTVVDDLGDGNLMIEIAREAGSTAGLPIVPAAGVQVIWRFHNGSGQPVGNHGRPILFQSRAL